MAPDPTPPAPRPWRRAALGLALLLVAMACGLGWAQGHQLLGPHSEMAWRAWLLPWGWWAPLAFVGLKVLGIALGLPTSPLTLVGGALFGFPAGLLLNVGGGSLGASLPFAYARWWGRAAIASRLAGRWEAWDARLEAQGFWAVLFLRLVPVVPFTFVNFAAGLSRVRFADFLGATLLGIVPGAGAITYLGASAASGSWRGVGLALGALSLLALLPLLRPWRDPDSGAPG